MAEREALTRKERKRWDSASDRRKGQRTNERTTRVFPHRDPEKREEKRVEGMEENPLFFYFLLPWPHSRTH